MVGRFVLWTLEVPVQDQSRVLLVLLLNLSTLTVFLPI